MRSLTPEEFQEEYSVGEKLGQGGIEVALKRVPGTEFNPREMEVLDKVGPHEYILDIIDYFECGEFVYMVFPLMANGDLADFFRKRRDSGQDIPYAEIQEVFQKIIVAVNFLHDNYIVHRDIKDQNILIDENGNPKLADFGLATPLAKLKKDRRLTIGMGSPGFQSPQVLEKSEDYSFEIDTWSLGVLLFKLFTGQLPCNMPLEEVALLSSGTQLKLIRDVFAEGMEVFHDSLKQHNIPHIAANLICNLLEIDPEKRMTCEQALEHPFFRLRAR